MRILRLENPVQTYSWGSNDGLAETLGIPNPGRGPVAELWMGAHPKAPSSVIEGGKRIRLDQYVARDPKAVLGEFVRGRFGDNLPFLFKALSAAEPLSVQAHPAKLKAERGFEREELEGIPRDAPERSYRDRNHKPEMAVALTRFEGLCSFRPIEEIMENFRLVAPREQGRILGRLAKDSGRAELSVFFYSFASIDTVRGAMLLDSTRERIGELLEGTQVPADRVGAFRWVLRLMELHPGDIGALSPLFLNHIAMEPGEGLFIGPGELHAWLGGTALEIMANSDNVIRGALTDKHVDLPELVSVLSFVPERALPAPPLAAEDGEERYPVLAPDFELSRFRLDPRRGAASGAHVDRGRAGPEIVLVTEGSVALVSDDGRLELCRGESAFIRADTGPWSIEGEGMVYRAGVPQAV